MMGGGRERHARLEASDAEAHLCLVRALAHLALPLAGLCGGLVRLRAHLDVYGARPGVGSREVLQAQVHLVREQEGV